MVVNVLKGCYFFGDIDGVEVIIIVVKDVYEYEYDEIMRKFL